jgi:hypothetical protein
MFLIMCYNECDLFWMLSIIVVEVLETGSVLKYCA